jgi:hypothetical protein
VPIPHLHLLHPRESHLPGITEWIAHAQASVSASANWDGSAIHLVEYDDQASFDVPNRSDFVRRNAGPVILVKNVQHRRRNQLEAIVGTTIRVYCLPILSAQELWAAFEMARAEYEDGEPRRPLRELIAYLIIRKLALQDKWGGCSQNKAFLWGSDLPKGGFPKDLVASRAVMDVAAELERCGVLVTKTSEGKRKFALGEKSIVQPILDSKCFTNFPALRTFFERDGVMVSARSFNFNCSGYEPE